MKTIKHFIVFTLLFCTAALWAQKQTTITGNGHVATQTVTTGGYESVNSAGIFEVLLVSGNEGTITLEGEENLLDFVEIVNNGKNLEIKVVKNYRLKPSRNKNIKVIVPVEQICKVSLAGSGSISSQIKIHSPDFNISLAGSGSINLDIRSGNIKASLAGSGNLQLTGKAEKLKLSVAGSGEANTKELQTNSVDLSIAGSGGIVVHCSQKLKARVAGSGDVMYYGNPETKEVNVIGSGSVKKV